MRALYAGSYRSIEEREPYRSAARSTIRVLVHAIIDLLKDTGIRLPNDLNQHFAILLHEVETVDMYNITPEGVQAVEKIWSCPEFASLYTKNFEITFPHCAPYFAQEARRIASAGYIPSEADIGRLVRGSGSIEEVRFDLDELDVHLFNVNGYHYRTRKFRQRWLHQFEGATALIYAVDVSEYDRPYLGQATQSQLVLEFGAFQSWATHEVFANSSIILLLNNFSRFRDKLQHAPLETFFEDYAPSNIDPETSARQYILRRFKKVNRSGLSIYSFWIDLELGDNTQLYGAFKKTLQHIQQRKAKEETWNSNSQIMGSDSRSGTRLAGRLIPSRSDTYS